MSSHADEPRPPDAPATPDPAVAEGVPPPASPAEHAGGHALPRTRTSTAFQALIAGAVVLVLLLIFILENGQSVRIRYLGADTHVALGVALLLAAVAGALLTAAIGGARISQLRAHARRQHRRR